MKANDLNEVTMGGPHAPTLYAVKIFDGEGTLTENSSFEAWGEEVAIRIARELLSSKGRVELWLKDDMVGSWGWDDIA